MFDAYEVAVKLRIKDEFSGAMGILTRQLVAANTHASELQNKLDRIGRLFKAGVMTTGAGFGLAI